MKALEPKQLNEIHKEAMNVSRNQQKLLSKVIELKGHLICYNLTEATRTYQESEILASELAKAKNTLFAVIEVHFGEINKKNVDLLSGQSNKINGEFLKMRALGAEFKEHKAMVDYTLKTTSNHLLAQFQSLIEQKKGTEQTPTQKKNGIYKRKGLIK